MPTSASIMSANSQEGGICILIPGRLFAIGASVDLKKSRPLFVHDAQSGWLPFQLFVIKDGTDTLIVDTGLPAHEDVIRDGLRQLMGQDAAQIFATRREFETIENLPWMLQEFNIKALHLVNTMMTAGVQTVAFFESLAAAMELAASEAHVASIVGAKVQWVKEANSVRVGGLTIEPIRSPIYVLSTYWLYESDSRTLFSSDTWAFLSRSQDGGACAVGEARILGVTVDEIKNHLIAKFGMLQGTDTRPVCNRIRDLFDRYRVDRICPTYGCVIEGQKAVANLVEKTIEALVLIERLPRRSLLDGLRDNPDVARLLRKRSSSSRDTLIKATQ